MLVDLDKKALGCLIRGIGPPSYEVMDHPLIRTKGAYIGGFCDRWDWRFDSNDYTEEELYNTYLLLVTPIPSKAASIEDDPVYRELQNILEEGKKLNNNLMIKAAEDELKRLGWC